jgi:hypothetical protein
MLSILGKGGLTEVSEASTEACFLLSRHQSEAEEMSSDTRSNTSLLLSVKEFEH